MKILVCAGKFIIAVAFTGTCTIAPVLAAAPLSETLQEELLPAGVSSDSSLMLTTTSEEPAKYNTQGETFLLSKYYGYSRVRLKNMHPGTVFDARSGTFTIANSRNDDPTPGHDCHKGNLPTNPYPVSIDNTPGAVFLGGTFLGKVPDASDWRSTYCNSAALAVHGSDHVVVDGVRIHRAWDGIRFSKGSNDFLLKNSWISESRDDCVENDQLGEGVIRNSLLDGCFMGISVSPTAKTDPVYSGKPLTLDGVLLRMKSYKYKDRIVHGVPFKTSLHKMELRIFRSVFALENENMIGLMRLQRAWENTTQCRDNLLLWLSDNPLPHDFPQPPSCFEVIKGQAARDVWATKRQGWIDCHSHLIHETDERGSGSGNCS